MWFNVWFGPNFSTTATPPPPAPPIDSSISVTPSDPDAVNHLESALDRLCEQFKGD